MAQHLVRDTTMDHWHWHTFALLLAFFKIWLASVLLWDSMGVILFRQQSVFSFPVIWTIDVDTAL